MLRLQWPRGSLLVQSGLRGVTLGRKGGKVMKSGHLCSVARAESCQWLRSVALIGREYETGSAPVLHQTCCRRSGTRHLAVGTGSVRCLCPPRPGQTAHPGTCFPCSVCREAGSAAASEGPSYGSVPLSRSYFRCLFGLGVLFPHNDVLNPYSTRFLASCSACLTSIDAYRKGTCHGPALAGAGLLRQDGLASIAYAGAVF